MKSKLLIISHILLLIFSSQSFAQQTSGSTPVQTLKIPSASFAPFGNARVDHLDGCISAVSLTNGQDTDTYAPLSLPLGSDITGIKAFIWDWAFDHHERPKLLLRTHDGSGNLTTLTSAQSQLPNTQPTFYQVESDVTPPHTVQPVDFFDLYFDVGDEKFLTNGYWICGVEIYYTTGSP